MTIVDQMNLKVFLPDICKVSTGFTSSNFGTMPRYLNRTDFGVKTGAMLRFSQLTNSQLFW